MAGVPGVVTGGAVVDDKDARPMRADALKNRARILHAAEEVFALEGLAVPIDAVAEKAGVGVGTLYRHFPNKEALFEAIVLDRVARLLDAANDCATADDPGAVLFEFLREFASNAAAKRDLFDALGSAGIDIKSTCAAQLDELMRGIDLLMQRAAAAGAVRRDVSTKEVVALVVGTCHAAGDSGLDEAGVQRMVGVVIDGLRP